MTGWPFPAETGVARSWFRQWGTRGTFPWAQGYPYWSPFYHFRSGWDCRHLPNLHSVHFGDLLVDSAGEIRRLAAVLDSPIDEREFPGILERVSSAGMRETFARSEPMAGVIWKEGANPFMKKGTFGDRREVLGTGEMALYGAAMAKALTPEAAQWLAAGGPLPA